MIRSSQRNYASNPNDFLKNPKFKKLIDRAKADIQQYWFANVNKYFSRAEQLKSERARLATMDESPSGHTNKMRNACNVSFINGQFVVIFKSVSSPDGKDYGDFLVYGTGISSGKFIPQIGARAKNPKTGELEGITRGISNDSWLLWKRDLIGYVDQRMIQLLNEIYAESSVDDVLGRLA